MRPIILKLLKQEDTTHSEWHDLFYSVHSVCLWDEKGATKIHEALQEDIVAFIKQTQVRVLAQREEQALLKAYVSEWQKFFEQSNFLHKPFSKLKLALHGKSLSSTSSHNSSSSSSKKENNSEESIVRKLMLDSWNLSIFSNIKHRLQDSAMKLVHAERNGETFDSQLVIGMIEFNNNFLL